MVPIRLMIPLHMAAYTHLIIRHFISLKLLGHTPAVQAAYTPLPSFQRGYHHTVVLWLHSIGFLFLTVRYTVYTVYSVHIFSGVIWPLFLMMLRLIQ